MTSPGFDALWEKYLAGSVSADEYLQLMSYIKNGAYDEIVQQKIDELITKGGWGPGMDEERAQKLLHNILSAETHSMAQLPAAYSIDKWRRRLAIAAGVLVVIMTGWWLLWRSNNPIPVKTETTKNETKTQDISPALTAARFIHLPDGSTVLLNKGSSLNYPETFNTSVREVFLTGEGYFDIRHDATKPFVVHTGNLKTTVLGTAFNIKAYPQQNEITVTVTRGKVRVGNDKKVFGVLTANQQISVNAGNNHFAQTKVDAAKEIVWKEQYLILDRMSLKDAAILIGNKYHSNILLSNDDLKYCTISATFFNGEDVDHVLTVVCAVINASYTKQSGDTVIISGKGCN